MRFLRITVVCCPRLQGYQRVKMGIDTGDHPPIGTYPYPIPDKARPMVEKEIEKRKSLGIIEPSKSAWTSPIVPIKKPDGSIRLCVDYRKLNAVTKPDMHYMPTLDDVVREVGASRVISVLDYQRLLSSGDNPQRSSENHIC